ncbi:MAG: permease [Anaerolineae bacterium]|nr:permease [Anaerolineae bacterium]MDW8172785.1 permease [Anaerolineae bacterium]
MTLIPKPEKPSALSHTFSPAPSKTEEQLAVRPLLYLGAGVAAATVLLLSLLSSPQSPAVLAQIFTTRFLGIFIEALPFLLLGTFTSGLIEAFLRAEDLVRFLPKNRVVATIGGAFLGLVFPVCECGVVPVARRLFTKGLPVSMGIAFLLAAPVMNPIVFASTFIAFGWSGLLVGRFVMTALVAIAVGLVFALSARRADVLLPAAMLDACPVAQKRPTLGQGLAQAATIAASETFEMGRYLVIGCLLAAAMQTFVPQEALIAIGSGTVTSVLALQVLAFVLSVCSTVDAFLALAFVNLFTTGSLVAFLSFGPMVDIKSVAMFLGVFQRRAVAYLILLPFLMNLLGGVLINVLNRGY